MDRTVGDPDVDQLLHRLEITVREQSEQFTQAYEVAESRVEVHVSSFVDVPEGIHEVRVIEMGVDAEHLTPCGADVAHEAFGETCRFANPVAASEVGEGAVERRWTHGDGVLPNRTKAAVVGVGGLE